MRAIDPQELGAPSGYANGLLAPAGARLLFVAGQIGWDRDHQIVSDSFLHQFDQALRNVLTVVHEAGGQAEHIGRLTLYVTNKREYLADLSGLGEVYRQSMGRHYPAMTLVEVQDLLEPGAKIEIEATAALP